MNGKRMCLLRTFSGAGRNSRSRGKRPCLEPERYYFFCIGFCKRRIYAPRTENTECRTFTPGARDFFPAGLRSGTPHCGMRLLRLARSVGTRLLHADTGRRRHRSSGAGFALPPAHRRLSPLQPREGGAVRRAGFSRVIRTGANVRFPARRHCVRPVRPETGMRRCAASIGIVTKYASPQRDASPLRPTRCGPSRRRLQYGCESGRIGLILTRNPHHGTRSRRPNARRTLRETHAHS
jgi:hypothetical protein